MNQKKKTKKKKGNLVCEYFAKNYKHMEIALGGRDKQKLESIQNQLKLKLFFFFFIYFFFLFFFIFFLFEHKVM